VDVLSHPSTAAGTTIVSMSAEMLPRVCALHVTAFRGQMSTGLGSSYVRAFMDWFVRSADAIALVAVDEGGAILGYVIGAPAGYNTRMNRALLATGARSLAARPWLLFDRRVRSAVKARLDMIAGRDDRVAPDLPRPTMSLVGIAVLPAASGRGVGGALMRSFEREALTARMASLQLSVYPENAAARRLYEKCGWRPLGSHSSTGAMYYGRVIS
jgi:ribosomal protein S18 acetylase RimI-like enzyme